MPLAGRTKDQSKRELLQGFQLNEARRFQKQQADTFPLSEPAKKFIQKSVWQKRWNLAKIASLLIIPAVFLDYASHTRYVQGYYAKLNGSNQADERESVLFLTKDCRVRNGNNTGYLKERFRDKYCRSLATKQFSKQATLRPHLCRPPLRRPHTTAPADLICRMPQRRRPQHLSQSDAYLSDAF